jgi:hypothetical protein
MASSPPNAKLNWGKRGYFGFGFSTTQDLESRTGLSCQLKVPTPELWGYRNIYKMLQGLKTHNLNGSRCMHVVCVCL